VTRDGLSSAFFSFCFSVPLVLFGPFCPYFSHPVLTPIFIIKQKTRRPYVTMTVEMILRRTVRIVHESSLTI
jgi:hypothetical protein